MSDRKNIDLFHVLDRPQLEAVVRIARGDTKRMLNEVVLPNMAQINERTGQENSPEYWAYLLVYFTPRIREYLAESQ